MRRKKYFYYFRLWIPTFRVHKLVGQVEWRIHKNNNNNKNSNTRTTKSNGIAKGHRRNNGRNCVCVCFYTFFSYLTSIERRISDAVFCALATWRITEIRTMYSCRAPYLKEKRNDVHQENLTRQSGRGRWKFDWMNMGRNTHVAHKVGIDAGGDKMLANHWIGDCIHNGYVYIQYAILCPAQIEAKFKSYINTSTISFVGWWRLSTICVIIIIGFVCWFVGSKV